MDGSKNMEAVFWRSKPEWGMGNLGGQVNRLEAGLCSRTLDGWAGLEGVEQGKECGVHLEVDWQGRLGARLEVAWQGQLSAWLEVVQQSLWVARSQQRAGLVDKLVEELWPYVGCAHRGRWVGGHAWRWAVLVEGAGFVDEQEIH